MDTKEDLQFVPLYQRFGEAGNGAQAELRRAASPEYLIEMPAFYRLMVGHGTDVRWQRIAFFLPYVKHADGADSLGKQLAKANVSEMRLFQVIRSDAPNDVLQLRRLVQQIKPTVDWQKFGKALFYWNERAKREMLEEYFLNKH